MVAEFVVTSYRLSANLDATRQQSTQKLGLHGAIHVRLCLHEMLLTVDIQMIPLQEIPIPPPNRYESLHSCGSSFASNNKYMFGNFNMQMKLVPGDSVGTATSYYVGF
ncbi:hypothetical protein SUGI_1042090 [Cryptomeria japonica]|nr:hypothetical protein SUGI_1042090 [Cryptomeria japonica]